MHDAGAPRIGAEPTLQYCNQVVAQRSARPVRRRREAQRFHDRQDETIAVRPAAIERSLAGAGALADRFDADRLEGTLLQQECYRRLDELLIERFGKGASALAF